MFVIETFICNLFPFKNCVLCGFLAFLQYIVTLHNGASNEIKEIEVCKKCSKVKPYCAPTFYPIMFKPFSDGAKSPKYCAKCFSLSKLSNIGWIFWIFLWQIMNGWSDKLEIWHAENLDPVLKKARKQQFYPGSRSLWILHLKYTNIFPIFSWHGSKPNYLDSFFKSFGQLVPSIWFPACLNCNWFFGNLTAAEICFQLIPKN